MLEQEMKIPVPSLAPVRERLRELGASPVHPLALEENWVLDDEGGRLREAGRLLRVRRSGGGGALTLKEPASFEGGVKTRVELETGVEDAERVLAILGALGFRPARRYQKRRETWALAGTLVALDETPMGCFVEVEGEAARLAPAVVALGLDPAAAVPGTYLDLWAAHRRAHPGLPEDMVFP